LTTGPPRLEDLPYAAALRRHTGGLAPDTEYDGARFDQASMAGPDGERAVFIECAFTRVTVQDGRLRGARFSSVWARDLRLMGTDLARTSWLDATLIGAVAAGVEAFGAQLRRVCFHGCKLDSVNFRDAALTDVTFDDCLLREVDFTGATLTRTVFTRAHLRRVNFTKASLAEVDLRGSELDIIAGPGSLRGATVSPGQLIAIAPVLAESLGIIVADG
jgi:uncharacterized protein YjbI with pentapeptide repeats